MGCLLCSLCVVASWGIGCRKDGYGDEEDE